MYFHKHMSTTVLAVALAATAGCAKGTPSSDSQPLWYGAERSVKGRIIGYGSGATEEEAKNNAVHSIATQIRVTLNSETHVRLREDRVDGNDTNRDRIAYDVRAYVNNLVLDGLTPYRGPARVGNRNYVAFTYDDTSLLEVIQNKFAPRCKSSESSLRPIPPSNALRSSVDFARKLARYTTCRDYELDYDKKLWSVVVEGVRAILGPDDLHKYFFPVPSEPTMQLFDQNNERTENILIDKPFYTVRLKVPRRVGKHTYWLYIDALGRVTSLTDEALRENGKMIGLGTNKRSPKALLNDDGRTRVDEYILMLECDTPLNARIPQVSHYIPQAGDLKYYQLGALLSETTDDCRWEGIDLTISST